MHWHAILTHCGGVKMGKEKKNDEKGQWISQSDWRFWDFFCFELWGFSLMTYCTNLYLVCPNRVINWWCTPSHLRKWTCCSGKSSSFDSTQLLHDFSTKSSLPASHQCWREDSAPLVPANRTCVDWWWLQTHSHDSCARPDNSCILGGQSSLVSKARCLLLS